MNIEPDFWNTHLFYSRRMKFSCMPFVKIALWARITKNTDFWATRSSLRSFTRTAHLLACSKLLALHAPSAALTHSLTRSLRSLPRSWDGE